MTGYNVSATDTTTSANGGQTCVTKGATTCTVIGLTNGDNYVFYVNALNLVGAGVLSSASNVATPRTVPGAPTSVTAMAGKNRVSVSWRAPSSSGGSPVTGYTVTAHPGGATCHATTTSCVFTSLSGGVSYTFGVSATNVVGTGPSSTLSRPATPQSVPGAPKIIQALAGVGRVTLTWKSPAKNGGMPIIGYNVYVGHSSHRESTKPVNPRPITSHSFVFRGKKGYDYYLVVKAVNKIGVGAASNQVSAKVK